MPSGKNQYEYVLLSNFQRVLYGASCRHSSSAREQQIIVKPCVDLESAECYHDKSIPFHKRLRYRQRPRTMMWQHLRYFWNKATVFINWDSIGQNLLRSVNGSAVTEILTICCQFLPDLESSQILVLCKSWSNNLYASCK